MKNIFKCTGCGAEMPFEELDFELREDASLTCPICKSKFTISALLTEPGAAPAEEAPAGEELAPETPAEETPAGEEAAPAGGAPEATPGPAAEVAASAPEQITAKESVEDRVAKAMEDVKSGKSLQDILGSLLSKPIKISSPRRLGMVGLREGRVGLHESVPVQTLLSSSAQELVDGDLWWDWFVDDEDLPAITEQIKDDIARIMQAVGIPDEGWDVYAKENPVLGGRKHLQSRVTVGFNKAGTHVQQWVIQWKMDGEGMLHSPMVFKAPGYDQPVWAESTSKNLEKAGLREDVDRVVTAGTDPNGEPVTVEQDKGDARVMFGVSYTWSYTPVEKLLEFVEALQDVLLEMGGYGKHVESLDERKYIDLTPTPAEYRHLLHLVVKNSSDSASRKWAKTELVRVQNVDSWKKKEPEETRLMAAGESVVEKARAFLAEKKADDECWTGDFATFSAKLFGACKDLDIVVDDYENVIRSLQEKEAIELNKDEVTICLKKAKDVFVDFLKGQVKTAEQQSAAVGDLKEPPKVAPDLGSAPAGAPAAESKKLAEEDNDSSKGVEEKVDQVLKKFFA
jgi:DNA-directed RNA polymerase subunit RPC12/RpoP